MSSMCTAVLICWDPATQPLPPFGLIYEGAIGQPRQTTSLCDPLIPTNWRKAYERGFHLTLILLFTFLMSLLFYLIFILCLIPSRSVFISWSPFSSFYALPKCKTFLTLTHFEQKCDFKSWKIFFQLMLLKYWQILENCLCSTRNFKPWSTVDLGLFEECTF
jgi:hypothetical protein